MKTINPIWIVVVAILLDLGVWWILQSLGYTGLTTKIMSATTVVLITAAAIASSNFKK